MRGKAVSGIMLAFLVSSTLVLAFGVQLSKSTLSAIVVPDDYSTIQDAINHANFGDTIFVRSGTYIGHLVVNKTVSLIGESQNTTIINGNMSDSCIQVVRANNVTLSGFTVQNSYQGISLGESSYSTISGNSISNVSYGVTLSKSTTNLISSNTICNIGIGLVILSDSSYNIIENNTLKNNTSCGIDIGYSPSYNTISGNEISSNSRGILLLGYDTIGNKIVNNNISRNGEGVCLYDWPRDNAIYHNNFLYNSHQVSIIGSDVNAWDDDSEGNFWSDYRGRDYSSPPDGLGDSPYVIDANNQDNHPLIHPCGSVRNLDTNLSYLTIQGAINNANVGDTIFVRNGLYCENVVVNKTVSLLGADKSATIIDGMGTGTVVNITASGVSISGFTIRNASNYLPNCNIYGSNVNSTSIRDNILIGGGDAGIGVVGSNGIYLLNSSYNNVTGNSIINFDWYGIILRSVFDSFVWNNSVTQSRECSIILNGATRNTIANNNITRGKSGIGLSFSYNNTLRENMFLNNDFTNVELWYAYNTIVSGNLIAGGRWGIFAHRGGNQTICSNTIINNRYSGLQLEEPWDTWKIFNNLFINNTATISPTYRATWDDSYPRGGNYWNDYVGVDLFRGPYQNLTGSDGIGDTPYTIDANNLDRYPLMNSYSRIHDVAVETVTSSFTEVYLGQTVNITVSVRNDAYTPETFNVTCKFEVEGVGYTIGTQTVLNLAPLTRSTITFHWTTADVGVHTIKAEIPPQAGETHTIDNTMTSLSTVKVKMLGDVNGDYKVDIRDIATAALAFGSYIGHSKWNPQADINHDDKIDIRDLVLVAKHYGEAR